ncbi:hypothetical protein F5B20DRAFT_547945 [Whalleya microplaca]|nr:hypothetical protein F5B20DRAFT_547945 [Whalleya microplaca]
MVTARGILILWICPHTWQEGVLKLIEWIYDHTEPSKVVETGKKDITMALGTQRQPAGQPVPEYLVSRHGLSTQVPLLRAR